MRLKLLVLVATVLAVVVIWRLVRDEAPQIDDLDARMEKLRTDGDVETLSREVQSPDIRTARRAVATMGYVGQKAVRQIRRALDDPRPKVRQQAAVAYARAADAKDLSPLTRVAQTDTSPIVRAAAVTALGQARAYEEMETLLAAMNEQDLVVRRRAAEAVVLILGRRYPYDPNAPSAQRLGSIAVIRQFWINTRNRVARYYDKERTRHKEE